MQDGPTTSDEAMSPLASALERIGRIDRLRGQPPRREDEGGGCCHGENDGHVLVTRPNPKLHTLVGKSRRGVRRRELTSEVSL
jgi:hypothetical protein